MWFLCGSCEIVALRACEPYLGVEWRRQISELCDVCEQRSWVVSLPVRPITALQTVPPLSLWYFQIAVARRRCNKTDERKRSSRAVCTWKRENVHACVCSAYPRVCPAGPASSGCCSCCWCWRCGCCRRGEVWSLSPGATTETNSTRRGRQRTPADARRPTKRVSKHFCLNRSRFDLFKSGKFSARGDKVFSYTHERPSAASTSCQPFKTSGGNTSGTLLNHPWPTYSKNVTLSPKQLLLNTVLNIVQCL